MSSRLSMKTPEGVKCDQCGMNFSSEATMQKHKEKFCIGLPDSGNNRDDLTLGDIDLRDSLLEQTPTNNNNSHNPTFYLGSPQPKAQSPVPELQPKPIARKQQSASIHNNDGNYSSRAPLQQHQQQQQQPITTNRNSSKPNSGFNYTGDNKQIKAIEELQNFKAKKSIEQTVKDMEDLTVRDTLRDKKLVDSLSPNRSDSFLENELYSSNLVNSKNEPYRILLKEYSEFKNKEKLILKEVYDLNNDNTTLLINDQLQPVTVNRSYNDLQDKENIKSPINNTQSMLPNLATTNNYNNNNNNNDPNQRYLKQIQNKTLELERERKEIQQKLEALAVDETDILPLSSKQSINRILNELKDQERINEAALEILKKRILKDSLAAKSSVTKTTAAPYMSNSNVNLNPSAPKRATLVSDSYTKSPYQITPQYQPVQNNPASSSSYLAKPYPMLDDSLTPEEIRSMRMNYLHSGGHDTRVLGRFTEMEYLSRYGSSTTHNYTPHVPVSTTYNPTSYNHPLGPEIDDKIRKVEGENKRLQMELEYLHEKYRTLNYGDSSGDPIKRHESYDQNLDRVKKMLLKYDSGRNDDLTLPPISNRSKPYNDDTPNLVIEQKNNLHYPTFAQQAAYRVEQPPHALVPKVTRLPNLISTQPYDPIAGFVMFIDFVSNLDVTIACSRVITCLHHPKTGLGEPSILPLVNCETYMEGGRPSTVALVSTKQPVPRCPPQQALTILIELQLASKEVNESKLRSCAWTKIPLFDFKNRLLTGRWRMPLKMLPIKSEAGLSSFNTFPSFNNVDFYYRLVDARDSDEQTNAPISPAYADQYNLPPQDESEPQYTNRQPQQQHFNQHPNQQHTKNQSPSINQHAPIPAARQTKALNNNNQQQTQNTNNHNNNIPQNTKQNNNHEENKKFSNNKQNQNANSSAASNNSTAKYAQKSPTKSKVNSSRKQE